MEIYQFLQSFFKVQTPIGLLASICAAIIVAFFLWNKARLKRIRGIAAKVDTSTKAELAQALAEVFPSYRIPDLTSAQGFKLVKRHLEDKAHQFKQRIRLLRFSIMLFFLVIAGTLVFSYLKPSLVMEGDELETVGDRSPIINLQSSQGTGKDKIKTRGKDSFILNAEGYEVARIIDSSLKKIN